MLNAKLIENSYDGPIIADGLNLSTVHRERPPVIISAVAVKNERITSEKRKARGKILEAAPSKQGSPLAGRQ